MDVDVVVIGGGIAGVSAAAFLSERADVVLVEAEQALGYHATGRSAALYTECYGPGGIPRLAKASKWFFTSPSGPLASPRGVLFVGDESQKQTIRSLEDQFAPTVPDLRRLSAAETLEYCDALRPDAVSAGLLEPGAMDLDVHGIETAFRRQATSAGAVFMLDHRVERIDYDGSWTVHAGGSTLRAPTIVNGAGAWGDEVAQLAGVPPIGLSPLKRSAFLASTDLRSEGWPLVVDAGEQWYFKPEGPNILGSAAAEIPTPPSDARPDEVDIALGIERINTSTTLGIRSVTSTWAGLRTFAADREPVVGFEDEFPGFFWLVGQGGYGIKTAPALGQMTAGLILDGHVPDDLAALHLTAASIAPDRFRR
ncbi:MAG: NAD(P)/FAD-dependent oxidoreductase [Acidimicrobiia bacterium]